MHFSCNRLFSGVLQRFGLTYLVVGVTESQLMPRQFPDVITPLLDVTSSIMQWILAFICLGLHTLITFSLPVPGLAEQVKKKVISILSFDWSVLTQINDVFFLLSPILLGCPNGYLGPGGLADNASHPNCTGKARLKLTRAETSRVGK